MHTNWSEWFVASIAGLENRLGFILELRRVRELWLQGELYLLSTDEQNFRVNEWNKALGGEFDFTGDSPKMIAELKICGRGYMSKVLNGYTLANELMKKSKFTFEDMERHHSSQGSIFKDYCRLRSIGTGYEKYMIMVIPKIGEPDQLGALIEKAEFPGVETSIHLEWFDVRVFKLPE